MTDKDRAAALARRAARMADALAKAVGTPTVFTPAPMRAARAFVLMDLYGDKLKGYHA